jgi:hypothetical protein
VTSPTGTYEPERFVPVLTELRDLLLKHELIESATFVAELIDLAHLDSEELPSRLQGGRVWGMGLADVSFAGNVDGPEEELNADDVRFRHLLIQLANEMKAQGINTERSDVIAGALRRGLEMLREQGEWVPSSDEDVTP